MKYLLNLIDFIGYSNLFLAFCAFCSTLQVGFLFIENTESAFLFAIINFLAAFCLYNIQRIFQSYQIANEERLIWSQENKFYIIAIMVVLIFVFSKFILDFLFNYRESILIYFIFGILSILYFLPPFEFRKIPFLKSFFIAFVWVMVSAVLPLLFQEKSYQGISSFQEKHWVYVCSQFLFISAICIPFDIRDISKDEINEVGSLPILLGIQKSKAIAVFLLTVYVLLANFTEIKNLVLIRCIIFVVSVLGIFFSKPNRHRYFYIYCIDGLIVFQTVILKIFFKDLS